MEGAQEFEYPEMSPQADTSELSPEDMERGITALRTLLSWVWQDGMKNADGLKIRSIIVCWIFLKELRSLSETDLAVGFGMHKQSVGRWVEDFKRHFPHIRIPQMR